MSSQQATGTMTSRQLWVAEKAGHLTQYFRQLKLIQLVESLEMSEAAVCSQDEMMREKYKDDKETLATQISHMNTVKANCVLLKGEIFPAMKIDPDDLVLHDLAIVYMAQLKAEYHFMTLRLQ